MINSYNKLGVSHSSLNKKVYDEYKKKNIRNMKEDKTRQTYPPTHGIDTIQLKNFIIERENDNSPKLSETNLNVHNKFIELTTNSPKHQQDNESNISENIKNFWEAYSESDEDEIIDSSSEIENYVCIEIDNKKNKKFSKLSFENIKNKINEDFDMPLVYNYSAALDILASYVKCHINIYLEASYYCSFKLNLFMMPSIFLSSACIVLSTFIDKYKQIPFIIAIVNAFISFLLSIISYLKLDAKSEANNISAYLYFKLKKYIEFTSGEILLFQDPLLANKHYITQEIKIWKLNHKHQYNDKKTYKIEKHKKINEFLEQKKALERKVIDSIQLKIREFKKTLKNIQENNKFILPSHIARKYSNVYNINIFTYIKSIEAYKLYVLNELRNVKNEMRFDNYYFEKLDKEETKENIKKLYLTKNELMREFFELHNGYALIDCMFRQEVKNIQVRNKYWYLFYLQHIFNFFTRFCLCNFKKISLYDKSQFFIPNNYRNPYHFGYIDKHGTYLLEKIIQFNRL